MAAKIILENNYGYKWYSANGISVRGYVLRNGEVYRDAQIAALLASVDSFDGFRSFLSEIDGCYCLVINRNNRIFAAVDSSRSMPLYYSADGAVISDSLKAIACELGLGNSDTDPSVLEELLHASYVCHNRTVFKNCLQLAEGQLACFDGSDIKRGYYYIHKAALNNISREKALELFTKTSEKVFADLLKVIGDRPIVISLSGGYDSRYVACMLKKMGAKDVSCYSYGLEDSFEIAEARHIAEVLGYRWTCVEYSDELVKSCFEPENIGYFSMINGYDSDAYIQNYAAVKTLHEQGWFKPDSVFITGLCNDMPTGFYINSLDAPEGFVPGVDAIVEHIVFIRHFHRRMGQRSLDRYKAELRRVVEELGLDSWDYQSHVSACDAVETVIEHSRLNLHMNDVHAFFGYEWLIPCWSRELLNFWYSMPLEYRVAQNLYEEFILTGVPAEYSLGTKKQVLSYCMYSGFDKFKARFRLVAKRLLCMPMGIALKEDEDVNNFNMLNTILFRKIRQKQLLGFRNLSVDLVLIVYLMEQWFGDDFYSIIKDFNESGRE